MISSTTLKPAWPLARLRRRPSKEAAEFTRPTELLVCTTDLLV